MSVCLLIMMSLVVGQLTDLVMHPDTRGCLLHICYDNTNLLQWSLKKDIQSGIYTV
jgi:hypothetical protein